MAGKEVEGGGHDEKARHQLINVQSKERHRPHLAFAAFLAIALRLAGDKAAALA